MRRYTTIFIVARITFQFTHPGRGATANAAALQRMREQFQFTHPGRGATVKTLQMVLCLRSFNSRTPGGVRQLRSIYARIHSRVSIHAPREGCDSHLHARLAFAKSFNSRTPGGVRQIPYEEQSSRTVFQFTHPGRGATPLANSSLANHTFQFTHPGRGATFG